MENHRCACRKIPILDVDWMGNIDPTGAIARNSPIIIDFRKRYLTRENQSYQVIGIYIEAHIVKAGNLCNLGRKWRG